MSELVMLDTMICIWAFKGEATPGQEEKVHQARAFIDCLDEEGVEVGISAVTLAELLVLFPDDQRQAFIRSLQDAVCVYAFDVSASLEAARLFKRWLDSRDISSGERRVIKADCQIAGTAIACKSSILYTDDEQLRKIAGSQIITKPMPLEPQQELDL